MKNDLQKFIYGTILVFIIGVVIFIGYVFTVSCGFSLACNQGKQIVERTPVPTISHAPIPALVSQDNSGKCEVPAVGLLGAWVTAGSPESGVFTFNDVDGNPCEGNYADDVRPLFVEANVWYPGSYSCVSCHTADVAKTSAAKLDLSSYQGILAGSQRESAEVSGTDILGGGNWEKSLLYQFTYSRPFAPPGHGETPSTGPIVFAGKASTTPVVTPTP